MLFFNFLSTFSNPNGIQIAHRISLYICIPVQAHAAVYTSYDYVLVDKAFDIDVVVAGSHVVEAVVIACDTILFLCGYTVL